MYGKQRCKTNFLCLDWTLTIILTVKMASEEPLNDHRKPNYVTWEYLVLEARLHRTLESSFALHPLKGPHAFCASLTHFEEGSHSSETACWPWQVCIAPPRRSGGVSCFQLGPSRSENQTTGAYLLDLQILVEHIVVVLGGNCQSPQFCLRDSANCFKAANIWCCSWMCNSVGGKRLIVLQLLVMCLQWYSEPTFCGVISIVKQLL